MPRHGGFIDPIFLNKAFNDRSFWYLFLFPISQSLPLDFYEWSRRSLGFRYLKPHEVVKVLRVVSMLCSCL